MADQIIVDQAVGAPSLARTARSDAPGGATARPQGIPPASKIVRYGDKIYGALTFLASLSIFVIILCLAWQLTGASWESIRRFGIHFVTRSIWRENVGVYGILPFIFGTVYSSVIALVLAVPVSLGAAIFLSELAPRWLRTPVTFLIELLAAIPSVVYGLWGFLILTPWLQAHFTEPLSKTALHRLPILGALLAYDPSNATGLNMFSAGAILAIMITPFITAVSRDILRAIPRAQREGSYALGATRWETIGRVVLPYAKSGIIGAIILGLGRALGETMAVTMVIGNQLPRPETHPSGISFSLFDPGYTMSSVLANKFKEANLGLEKSALVEIALVLFVVTIIVNIFARLMVSYTAKDVQGRK